MASEARILEVAGPSGVREVRISSPDRVLWPDVGITKFALAEYLVAVGAAVRRGERQPADLAPALRRRHRRRAVLLQEPAEGRARLRARRDRHLPERPLASAARHRRAGRRRLGRADEHGGVPPVGRRSPSNSDNPDQLRIDLDPQPGTDFSDAIEPRARASPRARGGRASTAFVKTSGNRGLHVFAPIDAEARVPGCAARGHRRLPRARTADARQGHDQVVEGGARRRRSSSTSTRPTATAPWPARTARGRSRTHPCPPRSRGTSCRAADPKAFTILTVPDRLATIGDPWETFAANPGSIQPLLDWWERDLANGLGELPFPPDFPKMPGEPPRVQPSKAKKPSAE